MNRSQLNQQMPAVVDTLVKSVLGEPAMQHLGKVYLPSRDVIIECVKRLRQLVFPGYFGKQGLTAENLPYRTGELVMELSDMLYDQVRCALRYSAQLPGNNGRSDECEQCDQQRE